MQIEELDEEEFHKKEKEFWNEKVPFTPESRVKVHEHMQKVRKRDEKKKLLDRNMPTIFYREVYFYIINFAEIVKTRRQKREG